MVDTYNGNLLIFFYETNYRTHRSYETNKSIRAQASQKDRSKSSEGQKHYKSGNNRRYYESKVFPLFQKYPLASVLRVHYHQKEYSIYFHETLIQWAHPS